MYAYEASAPFVRLIRHIVEAVDNAACSSIVSGSRKQESVPNVS